MQYGNPYFAQPFQQIQPYQDRLAQLQNNYQQAMPYGQAQIQQPIQQMPQRKYSRNPQTHCTASSSVISGK